MKGEGRGRALEALSLDRLIAFALAEALIDGYEETDQEVVFLQGSSRFRLPHRHAATFLVGMLRGRSWFVDGADALPAAVPEEVPAAVAVGAGAPAAHMAAGMPAERPDAGLDAGAWERLTAAQSVESTLDALLAFTHASGVIQHFEKDRQRQTVSIQIPACTSTMSYSEAVAFLFDCVQEQVRSQRRVASPSS